MNAENKSREFAQDETEIDIMNSAVVLRMARAWARNEGEVKEFDEGAPHLNDGVEGDIRAEYVSDMAKIFREAGISALFPLAEMLRRIENGEINYTSDIDQLEAFISSRMTAIARIEAQIARWKEGSVLNRDERWASQAQHAINAKTVEVGFARNLVQRFVRKNLMKDIIKAHAHQVREMTESKEAQRRKYSALINRDKKAFNAVMALIQEKAPEIFDEAIELRDKVQQENS